MTSDKRTSETEARTSSGTSSGTSSKKSSSSLVLAKIQALASRIDPTIRRRLLYPLLGIAGLAFIAYLMSAKAPTSFQHASPEPDPLADERPIVSEFSVAAANSSFGSSQTLSALKGKVVLVTFWATDCTTCLIELPAFSDLQKRYGKEGLQVLAINLDGQADGEKASRELWARGQYSFGAYLDPGREAAKILNVESLPSSFVIDRKGRMAFSSFGANDWSAPETARLIEDLLLEN